MDQAAPLDNSEAASPGNMQGGLGAHGAGQVATHDAPPPLLALFQDKRRRREDLRLLIQALNNGWDPENKCAIHDALFAMVHEPDLDDRILIRCCWAAVKMDQCALNTTSIIVGSRIEHPRMLTPFQRELRALLKAKPHLRAGFLKEWRGY
ncbi:MAG: hypothetical protein HPKKFMNG_00995 [Planctomycetes bacterium]|nr:hypothetical protein [Planctomycetota bacterium]